MDSWNCMWLPIAGFALVGVRYHVNPRYLLYCRVNSTIFEKFRCSQRWSTPLRPERNSLVERLKQTKKRMLHHVCRTNQKQWHKLRPIVLWCIRESNTWCYRPPLLNVRCTSLLSAVVSEMTYTVLSGTGTLNSSIPYHSTHDDNILEHVLSHQGQDSRKPEFFVTNLLTHDTFTAAFLSCFLTLTDEFLLNQKEQFIANNFVQ